MHDQLHPPETEVLAGCPPAEGPEDSASAALPAAGGRQHPRGLCPRQPLASPFGAGHSVLSSAGYSEARRRARVIVTGRTCG